MTYDEWKLQVPPEDRKNEIMYDCIICFKKFMIEDFLVKDGVCKVCDNAPNENDIE